ncbi:MAG: hypothetical protein ACRCV7_01860 [Culicoidibacterales bacterium]
MTVNEIKTKINSTDYWDAKVKEVTCKYFADEISIGYEGTSTDVYLTFTGCYNSNY